MRAVRADRTVVVQVGRRQGRDDERQSTPARTGKPTVSHRGGEVVRMNRMESRVPVVQECLRINALRGAYAAPWALQQRDGSELCSELIVCSGWQPGRQNPCEVGDPQRVFIEEQIGQALSLGSVDFGLVRLWAWADPPLLWVQAAQSNAA